MNIIKRYRLKKQQKELMQIRNVYERLQTDRNRDEYFCRYAQDMMDNLEEQAEHIRGVLEGRWRE